VEVLVVTAIIAVMAAIAVPSIVSWQANLEYKRAAWDIRGYLRYARELAATENLEHRVEIDMDGRRYRLTRGNLPSGSTVWTEVRPWADLHADVAWASGAACNGTADAVVEYNPNGSATAVATQFCIRDTGGGLRYRLTVDLISGRVGIGID
jgi:Tfp pilus assembly protein FimT